MRKIIVASTNPVKVQATLAGFKKIFFEDFEVVTLSAESNVSDQPISNTETLTGARNRAHNAKLQNPDADFWVGLEGGVEMQTGYMESFAWIYICAKNMDIEGKAKTATFYLPPPVTKLLLEGKELGVVDDIIFGMQNSKQGIGAVGILTKGLIDRATFYETAVILALVPFINEELYT